MQTDKRKTKRRIFFRNLFVAYFSISPDKCLIDENISRETKLKTRGIFSYIFQINLSIVDNTCIILLSFST